MNAMISKVELGPEQETLVNDNILLTLEWLKKLSGMEKTFDEIKTDYISTLPAISQYLPQYDPVNMEQNFFAGLSILDQDAYSWPRWQLDIINAIRLTSIGQMAFVLAESIKAGVIYVGYIPNPEMIDDPLFILINDDNIDPDKSVFTITIPKDFDVDKPPTFFNMLEIYNFYKKLMIFSNPPPRTEIQSLKPMIPTSTSDIRYPSDDDIYKIDSGGVVMIVKRCPNLS